MLRTRLATANCVWTPCQAWRRPRRCIGNSDSSRSRRTTRHICRAPVSTHSGLPPETSPGSGMARSSLRQWAKALKRQTLIVYFAARDPRTTWPVRVLGLLVAAYALSPIDLIPDFIPVLGYLRSEERRVGKEGRYRWSHYD